MPQNDAPLTGGCQCGAVRFRAASLGRASICHCRMCQKANGGFFGAFVTGKGVTWTRGELAYFQSSSHVRRGFCGNCGTPLTYEHLEGIPEGQVELAIGAFDHPVVAAPVVQVNTRDKQPFVDGLAALPFADESAAWHALLQSIVTHQHPDHDTTTWPPAEGFPN